VSSVRILLVCSEWWLGVDSWCERHNCVTGGRDGTLSTIPTTSNTVGMVLSDFPMPVSKFNLNIFYLHKALTRKKSA
jgi:hypothetical protein